MTFGCSVRISSSVIQHFDRMITSSPGWNNRAGGPFKQIVPDPSGAGIAYVCQSVAFETFVTCTISKGRILAASSNAVSIVILPVYARFASVTVARWIFALHIFLSTYTHLLSNHDGSL